MNLLSDALERQARYYQLQVAEINPLESDEDSAAFPAAAAAAPRFPQQSAASILIKSQLFPGMSLTQYLDQISPSSTMQGWTFHKAFVWVPRHCNSYMDV